MGIRGECSRVTGNTELIRERVPTSDLPTIRELLRGGSNRSAECGHLEGAGVRAYTSHRASGLALMRDCWPSYKLEFVTDELVIRSRRAKSALQPTR